MIVVYYYYYLIGANPPSSGSGSGGQCSLRRGTWRPRFVQFNPLNGVMFGGDVWWCVWCTPHVAAWPQWHFAQIEMEQNRFFQPARSLSSEIHIILKNNASNMTGIDKQKNVNLRFLQNFYCLTAMVWTWCWRWCQSFLVRSGPSLVDWLVVETSFEKLCETSAWRNILRNFLGETSWETSAWRNILRNFLQKTSWETSLEKHLET